VTDTSRYGRFYWCVKVPKDLSKDGEIYLMADDVRVQDGALVFVQRGEKEAGVDRVNLLIPAHKWLAVYAASVLDGSAVAVEHWSGEVLRHVGDNPGNPQEERSTLNPKKKYRGITKTLRYQILKRDSFRCRSCGRDQGDGAKLEIDHTTPEALGGETTVENLQTLCRDCNRGKGVSSDGV